MYQFEPVTTSSFDSFYRLLSDAFPLDEMRCYEDQRNLLLRPNYHPWSIYYHGEMVGLITIWQFPKFQFIEHFAVVPDMRNHGLGSHILDRIIQDSTFTIVLEAELPESKLARRRLSFYARHNFHENPYPYMQPAYGADRNPVPMLLLSTTPLSEYDFREFRKQIYQTVYLMDV